MFTLLSSYAFYNTNRRSVYDFRTLYKADDLEASIIQIADIINKDPIVKNKIFTIREILIPELIAMRLKMLTKNRERLIFTVNDIHENMTPENSWRFYRSNNFFSHPNLYYLIVPKVSDSQGDPGHLDRWEDSPHYDKYTMIFESKSLVLFKRKSRSKIEN